MLNINTYIQNVTSKIEKVRRNRKSKRENELFELVGELMSKNEPTTIKVLSTKLEYKGTQYIHQLVKKSERLQKVKVKGVTLIVTK
jgi:hypothetical protein